MTKLYMCSVCGKPIIGDERCNCPFCGAHTKYVLEFREQKSKWCCAVCNQLFDEVPHKCPVCGADKSKFVEVKEKKDHSELKLSKQDIANAQKALEVEVSNSTFYFVAAKKSDQVWERRLFRALGEVEYEHAIIWQTILKLDQMPISKDDSSTSSLINLKESHAREEVAILFYGEAAVSSDNPRLKMLFKALVEIENDHLDMSEVRIKSLS